MKIIFLVPLLAFSLCAGAFASEDPLAQVHTSLKDQVFVVETDEEMSAESLDRISGQYDLGFTLPEQEYHSSSHNRIDPLRQGDPQEKTSLTY